MANSRRRYVLHLSGTVESGIETSSFSSSNTRSAPSVESGVLDIIVITERTNPLVFACIIVDQLIKKGV